MIYWVGVPVFAWFLYNVFCLLQNYVAARKLGLPFIIVPITPENPLWIAFQLTAGPVLRYFPFDAFSFTRHIRLGWQFHDRYRTHEKLGDIFAVVSPARNMIFVADPDAIADIFARGRDFGHPAWMLEPLGVFGPNISTAEGIDWQRQRKLTAPPFNENRNHLVWQESLRQGSSMIHEWSTGKPIESASSDTRTLALNVLAYAAFQKSYPFEQYTSNASSKSQPRSSMSYRDALGLILTNIFTVLVIPRWVFSLSIAPTSWQKVGVAIAYFREYMLQQIEAERDLACQGKPSSGTLVGNLVRGSDESVQGQRNLKPLSEDELLGNIFVYNFAGHDTTAISLAYMVFLLVANPEVQDWVHEEIEYYIARDQDTEDVNYVEIFPKLKRCLAVMLETLRLYNPLPAVPKYTGIKPTSLKVGDKVYDIPADTLVEPMLQTSHTHPKFWGQDSLDWRPQRWIRPSSTGKFDGEDMMHPQKGVFYAWSEGIRNCPGKKFAQVESVAVIVALLREHVGEPVPLATESMQQARARTLEVIKDSAVTLLLTMRHPESIQTRWKRRVPSPRN